MGAPSPEDGLRALAAVVADSLRAHLAVALQVDAHGAAVVLATAPGATPDSLAAPFGLPASGFDDLERMGDWRDAGEVNLPSPLALALDEPVRSVLFLPTPLDEAPRSGVLLLSSAPRHRTHGHRRQQASELLRVTFTHLMEARRQLRRRQAEADRFQDLFESVTTGIVLLGAGEETARVNSAAGRLLDLQVGAVPAAVLADRMARLRRRCANATALDAQYQAQQGDPHHHLTTVWVLGERRIEVDTHPVLGDGRKGRLWLFTDVTAQWRHTEDLRREAFLDPLTGLYNRRGFAQGTAPILAEAARSGASLATLMIDIDHFKAINDQHGHPVGDIVLRGVAARLHASLRPDDLLARLGGEEFAILLAGLPEAEVRQVAERLRLAVAAAPMPTESQPIPARISIGAHFQAAVPPGNQPRAPSLEALLARADAALYAAKRQGRDRVVFDTAL